MVGLSAWVSPNPVPRALRSTVAALYASQDLQCDRFVRPARLCILGFTNALPAKQAFFAKVQIVREGNVPSATSESLVSTCCIALRSDTCGALTALAGRQALARYVVQINLCKYLRPAAAQAFLRSAWLRCWRSARR